MPCEIVILSYYCPVLYGIACCYISGAGRNGNMKKYAKNLINLQQRWSPHKTKYNGLKKYANTACENYELCPNLE